MEPFPKVKNSTYNTQYNTLTNFTEITEIYGEDELRIVLLGKTGVGKSSAGNTILGEKAFEATCSPNSQTHICQRYEKEINGRRIVLIDTPGIFDTNRPEEEIKKEIISCLVQCAPGPHVFIVVLEVTRDTRENQETIEKLLKYFTDDVVSHTVLLFTHGDDLEENMTIHEFINQSDVEGKKRGKLTLKDLAEKCGNRVHVIDNRHWNRDDNSRVSAVLAELQKLNISPQSIIQIVEEMQTTQTNEIPWFNILSDPDDNVQAGWQVEREEQSSEYRSNRFQITQLMKSINNILIEKNKKPYRNEALEEIGEAIKEEVNNIAQEENREIGEISEEDFIKIRRRAIERVTIKIERWLAGIVSGAACGALLGVGVGVSAPVVLVAGLIRAGYRKVTRQRPQAGGAPVKKADVGAGAAAAGAGVAVGVTTEIVGATVAEAAMLGAGVGTGIGAGVAAGVCFLYGGVKGAMLGYKASKTSDKPGEAAEKVSQDLLDKAGDVLKACWNLGNETETGDEAERLLFNP